MFVPQVLWCDTCKTNVSSDDCMLDSKWMNEWMRLNKLVDCWSLMIAANNHLKVCLDFALTIPTL